MALPPEVISKIGLGAMLETREAIQVPTHVALGDAEYIGLYFSAHWCRPCREFTPELAEWYFIHGERLKFKCIFVSADEDAGTFKEYFGEMPWDLAIPFGDPERRTIGRKYGVRGYPTLVIVDKFGNMVTSKGREGVSSDPEGTTFPWKPRSTTDILGDASYVTKDGPKQSWAELSAGKEAIGLYFSAHWCPPCRAFTPKLASWYSERFAAGKAKEGKCEIVFVSSDRAEGDFASYYGEMPWKALEFSDRATKAALNDVFEVEGIPTLVFIRPDGSVITKDGRECVDSDPEGFPWPPKARESLSIALSAINDVATLVMFTDQCSDDVNVLTAVDALDAVAAEYFVDGKPHKKIRFALASSEDADTADRLRGFLGREHTTDREGDTHVRVTIVNVPDGKKYLLPGGATKVPTKEELSAFVKSFIDGTAAGVGLKA